MDRISPAFLNNVSPILLEQLRQIVASNQQQLDNNNSNQVTPQRYQPSQTRPWPKYGQQRSNSVSTIKHTPPPEDTVYYTRVNQVSIKDEIFKQLNQGRHTPQNQFTPYQNRQETPTNMNSLAMMNSKGVKRQLDVGDDYGRRKRSRSGYGQFLSMPEEAPIPPPRPQIDFETMSDTIYQYYLDNKQTEEIYEKKMKLRTALHVILKGTFPFCGLYVVGSSMNSFGAKTSDMDMCLMLSHGEIDQKYEAIEVLTQIQRSFLKCSFVRNLQLIRAKVPILRFNDAVSGVEVDLNINNSIGIRNTHLLNAYAAADPRVKPLILFIKNWAKFHDINDASKNTLSSYSMVLMLIHYLQCGCNPPVLPSLQEKFGAKFSPDLDIRQLRLNEGLPPYASLNKESLGELFLGFLEYYTHEFNFGRDAISVRLGKRILKDHLRITTGDNKQWKFVCIEEPFNGTNTARAVYDGYIFQRIRRAFRTSALTLRETGRLKSLFESPF